MSSGDIVLVRMAHMGALRIIMPSLNTAWPIGAGGGQRVLPAMRGNIYRRRAVMRVAHGVARR